MSNKTDYIHRNIAFSNRRIRSKAKLTNTLKNGKEL